MGPIRPRPHRASFPAHSPRHTANSWGPNWNHHARKQMQCRGLAQSTVRTAATVAHGPQANAHTRLVMDVQELRGMNGRKAQKRMRMHPVMSAHMRTKGLPLVMHTRAAGAQHMSLRAACSFAHPCSSLALTIASTEAEAHAACRSRWTRVHHVCQALLNLARHACVQLVMSARAPPHAHAVANAVALCHTGATT